MLFVLLFRSWQVVQEERYRGVPQSELDRLDRIDPEVDEVRDPLRFNRYLFEATKMHLAAHMQIIQHAHP